MAGQVSGVAYLGDQRPAVAFGLIVVKRLVVRKGLGCGEDVDRSSHVFVEQAGELKVSGRRKDYGKSLSMKHWRCRHTGGAVEGRIVRGVTGTSDEEWVADLILGEER